MLAINSPAAVDRAAIAELVRFNTASTMASTIDEAYQKGITRPSIRALSARAAIATVCGQTVKDRVQEHRDADLDSDHETSDSEGDEDERSSHGF